MKKIIQFIKDNALNAIRISGFGFIIMFFGTYAGSEGTSKDWRRIGIPIIFFLPSLLITHFSPYSLIILLQHLIFRIGHGIPSKNDEGSLLGKYFWKLTNQSEFWTNFYVRGIKGLFLSFCFIGISILKGNWFELFYCTLGIALTFALIQWRNLGTYELKIKNRIVYCCKSDVICYGILGILGFNIIF
ncbi:MAG: hypothetical protein ACTSXT_08110 [Candidatus Helarchaeota archaeon]